jgi:Flp pilus assembly protein TadB
MARREQARKLLEDELRDAVGDERVERAALDIDRAIDRRPRSIATALKSSRLLLLVVGAALAVAGVVASLALDNWLLLVVALGVHAVFTVIVVGTALAMAGESEKPSPTAEAALAEQGVADPEQALSDLVEQVEDRRQRPS